MSSEEGEHLTDREWRYLRRIHKNFDYTNENKDKGKAPEDKNGSDEEGKEFSRTFLKTMQDIAREIKEMRTDRIRNSPRRPHLGECSGISQHWSGQLVNQPQVSPTFHYAYLLGFGKLRVTRATISRRLLC